MWGRLVQLVKQPQWWLVKVILVMIVGLFLIKKTNSTNSSDISSYEPGGLHLFIHGMITNSPESKKEKIKKLDSVRIVVNEINLGKVQPELFSNKAGAFFIQLPFHKEFEISFLLSYCKNIF